MDDPASSCLLLLQHTEPTASLTFTEALLNILLIMVIVGLNAFFVASEFALVSVRRTRIQKLVDDGASGGALAVIRLLDNPTRFISAVQLGVTLASLALGWVGEPTIARFLMPVADSIADEGTASYLAHGGAVVVAFAIIT